MSTHKGFVYILEDEPHICKIGYSKNSVQNRVKHLNFEHGKKFKIRGYIETNNAKKHEGIILDSFSNYRIKGEWFNLSYEEIKSVLVNCGYDVKDGEPKNNCIKVAGYYLDPEVNQMFIEICIQEMKKGNRIDRSALISEAIVLLYKERFKKEPS